MRLVEDLAQNPEVVAIGVICLLLGFGNFAPRFAMGGVMPDAGIRRMVERTPTVPRIPRVQFHSICSPEAPSPTPPEI